MAGDRERLVHYRAGEGFVPSRLDVDTGTRVVLVDESGGQLDPRLGLGQQGALDPGGSDGHAAHVDHGAAHVGHAAEHSGLAEHGGHADSAERAEAGGHGGHDHGDNPLWARDDSGDDSSQPRFAHTFDTSGYWRFHNAAAPSHVALVVALTPPGEKPEPLVVEPDALPSASSAGDDGRGTTRRCFRTRRKCASTCGATVRSRRWNSCASGRSRPGWTATAVRIIWVGWRFAEYGAAAASGLAETCQSGMRHGVMEQLFVGRGIANLADDVDALCPDASDAFGRHQCFHGVGHGVMAWTAYELEDALGICGRLSDESGQRSCYSGVFMENVVSGLSGAVGQRSAYVNAEDPHYPCNALPERYVNDCYWYQTSQMLTVFNQDLGRVADACMEAPASSRRSCFGSYGRDVGAVHRRNPYLVVQYCRLPESLMHRGHCIDGAARTLFWDSTQQDAGVALCAEVDESIVAEACWQSIVNQAHAVAPDLEPFCARLPARWRKRCLAR